MKLQQGDMVTMEELIKELWPQANGGPDKAVNHVSSLLWELRSLGFPIKRVYGFKLDE